MCIASISDYSLGGGERALACLVAPCIQRRQGRVQFQNHTAEKMVPSWGLSKVSLLSRLGVGLLA